MPRLPRRAPEQALSDLTYLEALLADLRERNNRLGNSVTHLEGQQERINRLRASLMNMPPRAQRIVVILPTALRQSRGPPRDLYEAQRRENLDERRNAVLRLASHEHRQHSSFLRNARGRHARLRRLHMSHQELRSWEEEIEDFRRIGEEIEEVDLSFEGVMEFREAVQGAEHVSEGQMRRLQVGGGGRVWFRVEGSEDDDETDSESDSE